MAIPSNIYNFANYRDFLKDRYVQLKEVDPAFSFRCFSKQAGFGSPNYLKLVMDGKRNLSEEAIGKFAKGLRLDNHESEYYKFMVLAEQCNDLHKKRIYEAKLLYLKELFKVKDLVPELYDYYHDWYHSVIREMIKKGGIKCDASWIGQQLVPTISEEEAAKSIELLKALGYVVEENGMLQAVQKAEKAEELCMAQKIHHEQMAELAAQSIYMSASETQDFESVTISLPIEKVIELKSKISELVASLTAESSQAGNAVYQLNVQLFALTKEEEASPQVEQGV